MKRTVFILLIIIVFSFLNPGARAEDALRIVYNPGVAPLNFQDKAGRPAGLFVDIWDLWSKKTGRSIRLIEAGSFDQSLDMIKQGRADLHAGLFGTADRAASLDFSQPLLKLDYFIFTHPSVRAMESLEQASGMVVGIPKGGYAEDLVRRTVPGKMLALYKDMDDLFRAALTGEIKVFVAPRIGLLYYLDQHRLANVFGWKKEAPLFSQTYFTAVKKGNGELLKTIDDGLGAIGADEREHLEDRWIVSRAQEIPAEFAVMLTDQERGFLARTDLITVHNESDWAPFNFNVDGVPKGFSIDYIKLLAEKTGLQVKFVSGYSWEEFLEMIKAGRLDVMLNIARSPERDRFLAFSPPYVTMLQALYTRKDFPPVASIEDLFGKRFATPKGFFLQEALKRYPKIQVVEVGNTTRAVQAVSTGKADAMFDLMPVVDYITRQLQITNLKVGGDIGIGEGKPIPLHLAVSKERKLLAGILAKGMRRISDREIRGLQERWLGGGESARESEIDLTAEERAFLKAHPVIRVHNEENWAPFNFFDNGRPQGLSIDYMNLLAKRLGLKIDYVTGPTWNEFLT
ncbi:MAG: transporter substrate-binding domain-containing protein, partial [Proteobacteria bacterium]|nr:transporter substrate-binding domain-containing protein [Pseudomonadota bacterium]